MSREVFLYVETTRAWGVSKMILGSYSTDLTLLQVNHNKKARELAEEKIKEWNLGTPDVVKFVRCKRSRWLKGEYFAHEYDKYVSGRARKYTYSNGYVEWEVRCLDKTLDVMDGMWDDKVGRLENGSGDMFYVF